MSEENDKLELDYVWLRKLVLLPTESEALEALKARDDAIIERCAEMFEGQYTDSCPNTNIAKGIRALKESE